MSDKKKYYLLDLERSTPGREMWWKQSKYGYTEDIAFAGKFTEDELPHGPFQPGNYVVKIPVSIGEDVKILK